MNPIFILEIVGISFFGSRRVIGVKKVVFEANRNAGDCGDCGDLHMFIPRIPSIFCGILGNGIQVGIAFFPNPFLWAFPSWHKVRRLADKLFHVLGKEVRYPVVPHFRPPGELRA